MRMLNRLFARVSNFGFGRRGDERPREEMEGHVAMQAEENVRAGMTPAEVRHGFIGRFLKPLHRVQALRIEMLYKFPVGLPCISRCPLRRARVHQARQRVSDRGRIEGIDSPGVTDGRRHPALSSAELPRCGRVLF